MTARKLRQLELGDRFYIAGQEECPVLTLGQFARGNVALVYSLHHRIAGSLPGEEAPIQIESPCAFKLNQETEVELFDERHDRSPSLKLADVEPGTQCVLENRTSPLLTVVRHTETVVEVKSAKEGFLAILPGVSGKVFIESAAKFCLPNHTPVKLADDDVIARWRESVDIDRDQAWRGYW